MSKSTNYLIDKNYGLYVEDYFNELLSIERKRSERSKNPFLLILINIKNKNHQDDSIIIVFLDQGNGYYRLV
jgi:hypothetical protein